MNWNHLPRRIHGLRRDGGYPRLPVCHMLNKRRGQDEEMHEADSRVVRDGVGAGQRGGNRGRLQR
jgi:hypothetical protein